MLLLKRWWLRLSFLALVLVPGAAVSLYYAVLASPVYVSTAQFAVRGISEASASFLSITSVLGSSAQSYDSYIITEYIRSNQMIRDVAQNGIDLREFYSRPDIDAMERIDPDMPLEYFTAYWSRKVEVSFNSTTGNIVLRVRAFSAEDAQTIAEAVLSASQVLVTRLSANAREQLIAAAQQEVNNSEQRLTEVRRDLAAFRDQQQVVDVEQIGQVEQTVISELERQLSELQIRRGSISSSLSADSPTLRVLDQQIASVTAQLEERRGRVGAGTSSDQPASDDPRLSSVVNEFRELTLSQEYAETAYTRALGSLETALIDARKQDRYFAIFEEPHRPEVPTEPRRLFLVLLFIAGFSIVWGIVVMIIAAIREHSV
ncbi:MAG: hypothetical protein JWR39_431 [Devosia sp.]|nr:hypothetical protein [Devosia sp.]